MPFHEFLKIDGNGADGIMCRKMIYGKKRVTNCSDTVPLRFSSYIFFFSSTPQFHTIQTSVKISCCNLAFVMRVRDIEKNSIYFSSSKFIQGTTHRFE